MSEKWRNWGITMDSQTMRHMIESEECPYCEFSMGFRAQPGIGGFQDYVVGHSDTEYVFSHRITGEIEERGAEAIECPNCFQVSWRHTVYREMSSFASAIEAGEIVLRVPGARDDFMFVYKQMKEVQKGGEIK